MSVARAAAHGVAWNMIFGISARILTLGSTLALTRFVAPAEYGAVLTASIAVMTAGSFTSFAFGQYLIARKSPAPVAFQAAVLHMGLGVGAMAVLLLLRHQLAALLGSPAMTPYLAWYAVAHLIERSRYVPERLLVRDLRFRDVARINAIGELAFVVVSLALASRWGAYAVAIGVIARSIVAATLYVSAVDPTTWLVWTRLRAQDVGELFGYGLPIMIAASSDIAATRWDNGIVSRLFGPAVMAQYNFAFSLAEVPVFQVADHIGDVLMPSFAKLDDAQRRAATVRAGAVMALVVWPLAIGLGTIAPTLVAACFDERWHGIAPFLTILSFMTAVKPITWVPVAYLQAVQRPRLIMWLSFSRAALVLPLVVAFGSVGGPLWACVGACLGYTIHSVGSVVVTGRTTGLPITSYLVASFRPLVACVPMAAAVTLTTVLLARFEAPLLASLGAQILVGGLVYVGTALLLVRSTTLELMRVALGVIRERSASPTDLPSTALHT